MLTLKDHVRGSSTFLKYKSENLWYETLEGLYFPVPISEVEDAEFRRVEKSILLMKWIKRQLEVIKQGE